MAEADYLHAGRRMLLIASVLTAAGTPGILFVLGRPAAFSYLFGAVVSVSLFGLLFRSLQLLDFTGEKGNTPRATASFLVLSQIIVLGGAAYVIKFFPLHTNAAAAGFAVAVLSAMLQQAGTFLWPKA